MSKEFKKIDLKLIYPKLDSEIMDLIIELDHLRRRKLEGSTPARTFFQLKAVFHFLESLASARIEGNKTTMAEGIESKIVTDAPKGESIQEIENMEKVLDYIDENIQDMFINRILISDIHKMVVNGLDFNKEGDNTPGEYRKQNPKIAYSDHIVPDYTQVNEYMEELFLFINNNDAHKYDLIKTAIAHHRFEWIHPFHNGNGRTGRLLTYAMLVKQGLNIHRGRIVNPAAVFCCNRNEYYRYLALADSGTEQGTMEWCTYVLKGLRTEIEKIDKLSDYTYLKDNILLPSLQDAIKRRVITELEAKILKIGVEKKLFKSSDILEVMPGKHPVERSRVLQDLKDKKMIDTEKENSRIYYVSFINNDLLKSTIENLQLKGFISFDDKK